ncbi:MAG: gliding motility-associated C-terminal domain-containing protein, partial [candidate division KSB1 bacterium]|nr:gliding motility-associated C-terminal domain-containing protein [candidate division KSB1 bacterium]
NASTIIRYQVPSNSKVKLEIYNLTGEKVRTLVDEGQEPGVHSARWDGTSESGMPVASGTYVYRLRTSGNNGTLTSSKRLVMVK